MPDTGYTPTCLTGGSGPHHPRPVPPPRWPSAASGSSPSVTTRCASSTSSRSTEVASILAKLLVPFQDRARAPGRRRPERDLERMTLAAYRERIAAYARGARRRRVAHWRGWAMEVPGGPADGRRTGRPGPRPAGVPGQPRTTTGRVNSRALERADRRP